MQLELTALGGNIISSCMLLRTYHFQLQKKLLILDTV